MPGSNDKDPHIIPGFSSDAMKLDAAGRAVQFHPDVPHRAAGATAQANAQANAQALADPADEFGPDSKRLTVGKDMCLKGAEISDCDRLVVEGLIDGNLTSGRHLEITHGGTFKGAAVVDNAEIAGTFEGDLKVHNRLSIHASGLVLGHIRYGQLEVERGGRLSGQAVHDGENREADLQPVGEESSEITLSNPTTLSETD